MKNFRALVIGFLALGLFGCEGTVYTQRHAYYRTYPRTTGYYGYHGHYRSYPGYYSSGPALSIGFGGSRRGYYDGHHGYYRHYRHHH